MEGLAGLGGARRKRSQEKGQESPAAGTRRRSGRLGCPLAQPAVSRGRGAQEPRGPGSVAFVENCEKQGDQTRKALEMFRHE